MKKILIFLFSLLLLIPLSSTSANSDFQKKLSCKVIENSVRVYLIPGEDTLKCSEYIKVVNTYLKREYETIIQILTNMNRGDDKNYWSQLYTSKKDQFLKLFSQKRMIESAMQDFEQELLDKSKLFLQPSLLEKQTALKQAIATTKENIDAAPQDALLLKALKDLENKLLLVDALFTSETMDSFMLSFTQYLTLFPLPVV